MIIGLTGNMGTGKSTVGRILEGLGAARIDADEVGRTIMEPGGEAFDEVVARFGRRILTADGRIDRAALGAIVFQDEPSLRTLEAMTHPRIKERIDRFLREHAGCPIVVVEAPLLFEAGMQEGMDEIWVTDCSRALQRQRIRHRDGLTEAEIDRRLDAQRPSEELKRLADVVIRTEGTEEELSRRIKHLVERRGAR